MKNEANWQKHGVRFEEAMTVFDDPLIVVIDDPNHSHEEDRYIAIGETSQRRLVVLSYTIRQDDEPRPISARIADMRERRRYVGADELRDEDDDDMQPYYDFSGGVRGKHYRGKRNPTIVCEIDEELAAYFPRTEDLNNALRMLIAEGRSPVQQQQQGV